MAENSLDYLNVEAFVDDMEAGRKRPTIQAVAATEISGREREATLHPNSMTKLSLVAVALQNMDNYRTFGIESMCIGIDATGLPLAPTDDAAVAKLHIGADGTLIAETSAGRNLLQPPTLWQPSSRYHPGDRSTA